MMLQNLKSRIRIVYRRSSKLTKMAICLAIVLSTVTLLVLHSMTLDAQAQTDALKDQAQQLEQENNSLEDKIEDLGSVDSVEQIAKDELGLVNPDTIIIEPEN